MTDRHLRTRPPARGASAGDAAAWAAATQVTETGREQLRVLLQQEGVAADFARRFANIQPAQRDGHALEWAHELSFNLDAVAKDSSLRAQVLTWLGQPHTPEDLRIRDGAGHTIAEVQAKAVASATQRLHELANDKYDGMQLLVPANHMDSTTSLIDRRLAMPEGPLHEQYRSVEDRVSDHLSAGGVSSQPMTTDELRAVSDDPTGYLQHLMERNQLSQLGTAAASAAGTAALAQGLSTIALARLRTGTFDDAPWTEAARQAAIAATRSGVVALAAQGISLTAQDALAHGATSAATHALADSTLPFALARGTWDLAVIAHGAATGRLAPAEAGIASAQAITRSTAVWACAAVGQTLIPVPVVGAMVGGLVGQYGAAMMIQGIRLAVVARDTSAEWDAEYEQLLRRTAELEHAAREDIARVAEQSRLYDAAFAHRMLPALEDLSRTMGTGTPDEVLSALADVCVTYNGTPQFSTMEEFNELMSDELFTLDLRQKALEDHATPVGGSRHTTSSSSSTKPT